MVNRLSMAKRADILDVHQLTKFYQLVASGLEMLDLNKNNRKLCNTKR